MDNKNIKKAGVILAVNLILELLNTMRFSYVWSMEYIWDWIYITIFGILAGTCVFGKTGRGVCFAAGAAALHRFVLSLVIKDFGFYAISHCLAYTLIFIGAMVVTLKQLEKWKPMIVKVWFLPAILLIGGYIIGYHLWEIRSYFKDEIFMSYFVIAILFYTAFTYLCLGVRDAAAVAAGVTPTVNPVYENQTVNPVSAPLWCIRNSPMQVVQIRSRPIWNCWNAASLPERNLRKRKNRYWISFK